MTGTHARHIWGARPAAGQDWAFAIWAPDAATVALRLNNEDRPMVAEADGVWRITATGLDGDTYGFVVDGVCVPDPAARRQAGGVHDLSVLHTPGGPAGPGDPIAWQRRDWAEAVIFEMHIGTFTEAGTFAAAVEALPALAGLGITMIEVMPIAQFPGQRGWGYDGVLPYAVHPAYGTADAFRAFVDACHGLGMGVLLDVVYNHFGPEGACLHQVCPAFFDAGRTTPWGPAIDFRHQPVREFFIQNAEMWIAEFGVDGLRLDAVHQIVDPGTPHLIAELAGRLRALDPGRPVHLIAEDERNLPDLRETGGIDAAWNDDWHHAVHCLTTGEDEGYYASFAVDPVQDLLTALSRGHIEEGQVRPGQDAPRGAPSGHLPVTAFVNANQTHDQIGNRAMGERLISLAGPEAMSILHALLLTSPYIPMLFMGEEIGSRSPFRFFADFEGDLAEAVRTGRAAEFEGFSGFGGAVPDPLSPDTFAASRPYAVLPDDADVWRDLTRRLLAHRARRVVPLLRSRRIGVSVDRTGDRAVRARWTFAAGRIDTVAHLGTPGDGQTDWSGADIRLGDARSAFAFMTKVSSA